MGVDIIVSRKNDSPDSDFAAEQSGHRFLALYFFDLDDLAESLKLKKLSDFIDTSETEEDFYEEIHGEEAPDNFANENHKWFEPAEAIASLKLIMAALAEKRPPKIKSTDFDGVLADLEDCLNLLQTIEREGDLFSFEQFI